LLEKLNDAAFQGAGEAIVPNALPRRVGRLTWFPLFGRARGREIVRKLPVCAIA